MRWDDFMWNEAVFEDMRSDGLEPDTAYEVLIGWDEYGYAFSPDGVGLFWYETREELEAEHG